LLIVDARLDRRDEHRIPDITAALANRAAPASRQCAREHRRQPENLASLHRKPFFIEKPSEIVARAFASPFASRRETLYRREPYGDARALATLPLARLAQRGLNCR
jgi:hypothetical protein